MNRLVSSAAVAALVLVASLPAAPAMAAAGTITVSDVDPLPGQTVNISGDGDDCPADASGNPGTFATTLTYTTPTGTTETIVESGSVAANGTFTTPVTLPETAVSDSPANIISAVTCSGVETLSNRVVLAVLYHTGTMTLSASTVSAGGTITATGNSCYGGEFVVVYGTAGGNPNDFDSGTSGVPAADRSFTSTLAIPATLRAGRYDFYALCPGTEYIARTITVNAGSSTATPAAATSTPLAGPTRTMPVPTAVPATTEQTTLAAAPTEIGGGFTGGGGTATGGGTTPVATAPVAVEAEASFTG